MIISKLMERRASPDYDGYYIDSMPSLLGSLLPTSAGIVVNTDIAMTYSAFYACVKVISETIAMLPLFVYKRLEPRGKERAPTHPLYVILHDEPNPEMTSFQWRETAMQHLLTWGNHYSNIERDRGGRVRGLWPLRPDRMRVRRNDSNKIEYLYRLPGEEERLLRPDEVLHLRGGSSDGLLGQSPVGQMRNAIALGISTEDFGNEFYKNGLALSGVLGHPGKLEEKGRKNLEESVGKYRTGMGNRHRFMVLEEGMSYTQVGIPPENAQFLETRKFQLEEMCRIHRLQLHKVQHLEHATFSNIEHQAIEFTMDTVQPWGRRIESDMMRQLLSPSDKAVYFVEFLLDGLLRGDIATRFTSYGTALGKGWMSINDVREIENMNASDQDGADDLYHENIWYKVGEVVQKPAPALPAPKVDVPPEDKSARQVPAGKLREQYAPLFEDSAARIVRIEVNDVRRAVEKHFKKHGAPEFEKWLDEFYVKFPAQIEKNMKPLIRSYGAAAAADNISADKLDACVSRHVDASASRYVGESSGQLKQIIREAAPEDVEAALMARLDEWDECRAGEMASRGVIEASDVFINIAIPGEGE